MDVVAVFVDEAIEHTLSLLGAASNTVGDYDTVEYELTARELHHEIPPLARRMSTEDLIGAWRSDMVEAICTSTTGGGAKDDGAATEVRALDANESKETPTRGTDDANRARRSALVRPSEVA